jgi:SAM-dependent methyltransferase
MATTPVDIMERMRNVWGSADYHPIAVRDTYVSELLVQAVDVHPGKRVLDVAAGSGNTAIAAARRGAVVTATDFIESALKTASRRAAAEGLELSVQVADAQELPFQDGAFDVVLSTFGVMYAPDHQRAADELMRVCRPGGRIGLANWIPGGLVARLQAIMAANASAPPPAPKPGSGPPVLWGTEKHCKKLFGNRIQKLASITRRHEYCAATAQAQVDLLLNHLAPWRTAYNALAPEVQQKVTAAAIEQFEAANRATDGTNIALAEYLEVVATVR